MAHKKRPIDLHTGWPSPSLLPPPSIKSAANVVLSDPQLSHPSLLYGKDAGDTSLRSNVASWLSSFYAPFSPTIDSSRICITGGASQSLACILQTFTDPLYTRNIWMVSPTYFLACRIFDDNGFAQKLRAVPEDEEGINLAYLAEELRLSEDAARTVGNDRPVLKPDREWRKIFKHVIYGVPSFANPSGRCMSTGRREGLVKLAREYDALIVSDDVYDMLQWRSDLSGKVTSQASWPRLVDVDRRLPGTTEYGNTISNGSFSKLIGPGVRTGWVEGTAKMCYGVSQTGSSRSGGCPSQLVATFISEYLASGGLEKHIKDELVPAYSRRYYKIIAAVKQHLEPLGVSTPIINDDSSGVRGGYFVFITLPARLTGQKVAERAKEDENLVVTPGARCRVTGDDADKSCFERNLRLCFSYAEEEALDEGVQRLGEVIKRELDERMSDDREL